MPLAVFISHSGKTVELEVGPHARVDAVQQTLAGLTGIAQSDQILMCEGARLDGAKSLSAYGLPGEEQDKVHDLFLYSRAHLRADTPLLPPEALPDCILDLSGLEAVRQQRHRLDSAGSPLLRALPDYQRQFQEHLLQGNARHEASQQRIATCGRLVSEQEVQALSIDAATANVEVHYAYICGSYNSFMARYQQEHAAHADVLARFEQDMQYLAATELHPALRSEGSTHLVHLVNAEQLRQGAAACARGHQHFASKVGELENLFGMLKADVEALFMQAPSVDLEALTHQLEQMHVQVDEQASIVAALSSDLNKVQQLVEQTSEQLAADTSSSVQVSDMVHMLETMHETHVGHLIPRVTACHQAVESFAEQCLECKNALTRDVFTQLRTISSQQSKIREMKNKLALFREALTRQEASVQELLVVRRVPAAYKQCLAECVRRDAFMEKYAHSAAQLAERMGNFREKELAMRESFRKHVERLIPLQVLERMGLLEQPPHCQVSVAATEGERLLSVTVDDVRRIQLPWGTASIFGPQPPSSAAAAAAGGGGGTTGSGSREGSIQPTAAEQQQQQEEAAAAAAAAAEVDITASLQLENAKLRAELASQIALDCIRSAQIAGLGGVGLRQAAGSGQASPQLGLSALSSPKAGGVGGSGMVAAAAAAAAGALPPDAAQRFERALATKDSLVAELQAQLGNSRQQAAAYESRIQHLEAHLADMAAAADGRISAAAAAAAAALPPGLAATSSHLSQPAAAATSVAGSQPGEPAAAPSSTTGGLQPFVGGPAASGSSSKTAAEASMPAPAAVAQGAAAEASASNEAAEGSSLSGSLPDAEIARSLGASSSLLASPGSHEQPPQSSEQQQAVREAAGGPEAEKEVQLGSGPVHQAAAAVARAALAASPQARLAAAGSQLEAGEECLLRGLTAASTAAAEVEELEAAVPADTAVSSAADEEAAAAAHADASSSADRQLSGSAGEAAVVPASSTAADATAGGGLMSEAAAAAAAPPPLLLASLVLDEGSDVEGIEPISDSDCEYDAAGSIGGGYDGARPGDGEQQPGGEQAQTAAPVPEDSQPGSLHGSKAAAAPLVVAAAAAEEENQQQQQSG